MLVNVISIDADWLEKKGILEDALDNEDLFTRVVKGDALNPKQVQPAKKWISKEFVVEEPEPVAVSVFQKDEWPEWWAEMVSKRGEPTINCGIATFSEPCF